MSHGGSGAPGGNGQDELTALINRVAGGGPWPAPATTGGSAPDRAGTTDRDPPFDATVEQLYGLVRDVVRRVRRPRSNHHTPETTDLVHRVWERTVLAGTSPGGADGAPGPEAAPGADADARAAPDATDPSSDAAPARHPDPPRWQSREHFFNLVATATVQTLINEHRHRTAARRGGDAMVQSLDALPPTRHPALADARSPADLDPHVLADLLEALDRFRLIEPRGATIVTLRFLAGLTIEEVAVATNCSPSTVSREWRAARAWLFDQLAEQWPELARRGGAE